MHRRNFFSISLLLLFLLRLTAFSASPIQERADRFLKLTNAGYQALFRVNSEAQWLAVTDVTPEHDAAVEATGKAYAAFNGNPAIITEARDLLAHEKELTPLSVRQLKQLLLNAAEGPMTNPDLVSKRVEAETKQASILNSFEFKLNGQKITANEIDNKLEKSTDLEERKAVWEASKEFGPPSPRGEEWCDAATKTHINDTPAYYYNYAFATVFKFQLHDYIARKILHQPPQSCNYADNKEVGTWLNNILKKGSTEDWRKVLKEATGEDISTRAMVEYFKPLQSWLEEQNKGRQIGWE
jgi:hypothetical protein